MDNKSVDVKYYSMCLNSSWKAELIQLQGDASPLFGPCKMPSLPNALQEANRQAFPLSFCIQFFSDDDYTRYSLHSHNFLRKVLLRKSKKNRGTPLKVSSHKAIMLNRET